MSSFFSKAILSCSILLLSVVPAGAAVKGASKKHHAKVETSVVTLHSRHKLKAAAKTTPAAQKAGIPKRKHKATQLQALAELKRQLAAQQHIAPAHHAVVSHQARQDNDLQPAPLHNLSCRSAFIMDAETGKPLYAQAADLPGQPASTIKVVTGLIAIENLRDRDSVRTSSYAASMPRSKVYLRPGSAYPADDLINAVLLASANDASVALAEKIAGSEEAFARLMTRKAQALGAHNTICKSANGLTKPGQQTTARDLAMIFNHAMQNPEFAERMSVTTVRTSDGKTLHSHNKALWTVDGAVGGKTGYTDVARKTYVGKFQRGSQSIVVALLGSEAMWRDISTLVEHGFELQQQEDQRVAGKHSNPGDGHREHTRL